MRPNNPEEEPEKQVSKEILDWLRQKSKLLLTSVSLIIIGFLLGVVANIKFFQLFLSLGFFLFLIWGYRKLAKHPPKHLKREQVLESWTVLIKNGQGRAEDVFEGTQSLITESKAPDIEMEHQSVAPSIIGGMVGKVGKKRKFLVIRNHTNRNLKTYQMYINARDYGNNLHVSWYLVTRIGFWKALSAIVFFFISREPKPETLVTYLNLFDQQDLNAYVTNAHHCLLEAVEKLMFNMGQDSSKIDRKSRGFLGIS